MKRINLPLILDAVFAGVCAFLLFFTAVRFYTRSAAWGLAFGIIALILFGALAYVYISRKQNKKLLLSKDERDKKLLALHLSLSPDGYIRRLFCNLFGDEAKISGKKVVYADTAYFFNFKMQPMTEDDVAAVIKYRFDGKKKIYCNRTSPEAAALAASFSIGVSQIDDAFAALKEKKLLPEKYVYEDPAKIGFFKKIKSRFNRKLCAPLFWSGTGLLLLSYLTFYPIYYIVSGSVLLLLSAVALVVNQR